MKRVVISIIISVICGVSFCASPAEATLITIEITAEVDYVEDNGNYLDGQINIGDIITGTYIYDSTTLDSNPSSQVGDYWHYQSPCGIFLSVGGFEFVTDLTNVRFLVEIINDSTSGGLHDAYGLISYNNLALSNGSSVDEISWWLTDPSATVLTSTVLPTTAPVLDDWQSIYGLRLQGERVGYLVDADVISAIPEPATILLFTLGGLFLRKRSN